MSRPEGAPPPGQTIVHLAEGLIGVVLRYHAPGAFRPDGPDGEPGGGAPIDAWCVELRAEAGQARGHVLFWRPENVSVVQPHELELLGGAAAGVEALLVGVFKRAKAKKVPFGRSLELVGIALRAQMAALERTAAQAAAPPPGDKPTPP